MPASTAQSRKAKGRNLQKQIKELLLTTFSDLTENDVFSRSMGASGTDVYFSEKADAKLGIAIEAKNQESLNIWAALEQAASNAINKKPVLFFKRNRSPIYVAIPVTYYLELLKSHVKDSD